LRSNCGLRCGGEYLTGPRSVVCAIAGISGSQTDVARLLSVANFMLSNAFVATSGFGSRHFGNRELSGLFVSRGVESRAEVLEIWFTRYSLLDRRAALLAWTTD
jgi:hypothetical protein